MGNHKALNGRDELPKGNACAAAAAVVVMVNVAGVAGLIEFGFREHCGACAVVGCTEQVRETALLKPFTPSAFTVAVELCPGLIGSGAGSDAERENSGVRSKLAVTV
jgi:hypothetical protein